MGWLRAGVEVFFGGARETRTGRRFDELVDLIEEYEAQRDGYDLRRMKQLLATAR